MNLVENKWFKLIGSYVFVTLGTLLLALSLNIFLEPNTIAPGGVTGFAVVMKKLFGIEVYIMNLAINVPLFIVGVMVLGKVFGAKTLYATITLSVFLKMLPHTNATNDILLASIFGGVLAGIGIGLVFKAGGTTGGTDLAGAILNKFFPRFSIAKLMMSIDICVVIFAGLVSKKIEISLYSILTLYISVKVIDQILEGMGYAKSFFIISQKPDEIGMTIIKELNRGVTVFKGKGMYTGSNKDILYCVVNRAQIVKLKKLVYKIDKKAFVIVNDANEVLGEGFKRINMQ
ncbi:YitT family protein [Abyssisolibacter fermentans]|uniref:YitT family protein n=1 Tax=Abyssisolibacter fermentans TaxID=1766203 RepID=UPI000830B2DE|nr:YitT family protein [Abyssisolibacter fermentans]